MVMGGGQQAGMHEQSDGRSLEQVSQDADITQAVRNMLGGNSPLAVSTANGIVRPNGKSNASLARFTVSMACKAWIPKW